MGIYDNPRVERYAFLGSTIGATLFSRSFIGAPGPGKKGIVRDILINVTTALVGTTSVPEVRVGTAASDNSFARWLLGTSATVGLGLGTYRARTLCTNAAGRAGGVAMRLTDFANHIFLEGNNGAGTVSTAADSATGYAYIPADTAFFITGVAGVGSPAGAGDIYVDIEWW